MCVGGLLLVSNMDVLSSSEEFLKCCKTPVLLKRLQDTGLGKKHDRVIDDSPCSRITVANYVVMPDVCVCIYMRIYNFRAKG